MYSTLSCSLSKSISRARRSAAEPSFQQAMCAWSGEGPMWLGEEPCGTGSWQWEMALCPPARAAAGEDAFPSALDAESRL